MWVGTMRKYGILALIRMTGPALAPPQTVTTTFNVTATVLNNCAVSASDLAFGNYSAGSATPVTANTSISVTCAPLLPYTVSLEGGSPPSLRGARAMTDGSSHNLNYSLYTTNS